MHELGLRFLRYGLPYYKVHLGPGRYDWEFADLVMAEMRRLGITPIIDLLHFGVPDWLGNFQNPELPLHFADYADAFAERYSWVRYYTPVNEIYVSANASAQKGIWNEQLQTERGFVTAIKHLCAASILANQRIARRRPDVIIVQSESAEFLHQMTAVPDPKIVLQNELRFLSLDLLYANRPSADICLYMMDNGLTRSQYDWFMAGKPPGYQVMGNDYYGRNERLLLPSGEILQAEDIMGWYGLTLLYYQRYHKPIMHTETNVFDPDLASAWLWKQFRNILRMRGAVRALGPAKSAAASARPDFAVHRGGRLEAAARNAGGGFGRQPARCRTSRWGGTAGTDAVGAARRQHSSGRGTGGRLAALVCADWGAGVAPHEQPACPHQRPARRAGAADG